MSEKYYAAIDLGTNSCRLAVADSHGNYVYNQSAATRLGEGMSEHNCFTPEAVARGLSVLKEFGEIIKDSHCKYRAIATAACRMATNGAAFVQRVKEECGVNLEVVDGAEEARLNLVGALANADKDKPYIFVYDIGGGSTEMTLAHRDNAQIIETVSIPWGARNASEKFALNDYDEDKAQVFVTEIMKYTTAFKQKCQFDKYQGQVSFVATSSTPLRLSAFINHRKEYDREAEDGSHMTSEQIEQALVNIYQTTEQQRATSIYIGPKRAPIFVAGSLLLRTINREFAVKELIASYKSAKDSIIMELISEDKNGASD